MDSLKEHEVYTVKPGRVLDAEDIPVPDVLSTGLAVLTHGSTTNTINPIAEFNEQYNRLRERRSMAPISDTFNYPGLPTQTSAPPSDPTPEAAPINESFDTELPDLDTGAESESSESSEGRDNLDADLFMESPTLPRLDEDDVALEMDEWDLNEGRGPFDSESEESDGEYDG